MRKFLLVPALAAILAHSAAAAPRPYEPQPVAFPAGAAYLSPTGEISIVGYNDMQGLFEAWDRLFAQAHPQFRFNLVLKGTRTAAPALAAGRSALAPMGAEMTEADLAACLRGLKAYPVPFRVAHAAVDPRALSSPIAVYVNSANPLAQLSTDQVARIFTAGSKTGDLILWGQLGLTGDWAGRLIHPVGLGADTALGVYMLRHHFGGRPFAARFQALRQSRAVVQQVSADPQAIGFADLNLARSGVAVVAVDPGDGRTPSRGSAEDVASGRYPYDRHLLVYAPRPLDPWVREYLRMVYSKEGQAAVAATPPGYIPLNPGEVDEELAKLER